MNTTLTQSISHSVWRNASYMSAYSIKSSFGGSMVTIAGVREGLPCIDAATSRIDVQTAVGLLNALSPVNV